MLKRRKPTYVTHEPLTANQVLEKAAEILVDRYARNGEFNSPSIVKEFLSYKLGGHDREVFAILLLDSSHHLIEYREMFYGTIDSASVHPREIIRVVLETNAASVILSHNHPSGNMEPSVSDQRLTKRIVEALALADVRVLDHIIVGETAVSLAELGLL